MSLKTSEFLKNSEVLDSTKPLKSIFSASRKFKRQLRGVMNLISRSTNLFAFVIEHFVPQPHQSNAETVITCIITVNRRTP